jgi:hypothetical protein
MTTKILLAGVDLLTTHYYISVQYGWQICISGNKTTSI